MLGPNVNRGGFVYGVNSVLYTDVPVPLKAEFFMLQARSEAKPALISIVVTASNEEETLPALEMRVHAACECQSQPYEFALVNDGGRDGAPAVMHGADAAEHVKDSALTRVGARRRLSA